ncbi:MAG: enzyme of heme biosynthesis [Methylomonas sp.]|nr:MAG: enzyme of heme biosynthesis [Methylomonas sp.]PPD24389.1 MAG: enzyme of heme biosynthesis [Methylomonas sp.]PPD32977.1 MAG: enzyme of heme biosynthesis [Methylomonas sp.]PPD41690.1 MAG: enzyme of heme biosynthesis [Methylomonas sp.]PPD54529.1 MAG: enzyme of heme biosynthesis [Methylomonas sp.]
MAEDIVEQQETKAQAVVVKKSLAGLWIGIISIVLVIGLGVAGFYVVQQMRTVQDTESNQESLKLIEVDKEINGLQNQLTNLQSQIANLNTTLSNKDDHFNKALDDYARLQNERLDTTRKDLEAAIKTIQQQIGKTRGDWLLADADYLLSIANQRLHLVSDVETTRLALEAADQRLRESGDPAVFKVREQIAKEIALLNNVVVPDIVGIYAGLQHLQDAVEGLSVFLPHAGKQPEKAPAAPDLSEHGHELLGKVAKQLEGYVVLRHTEQPVSAILTPEEAHFIKQQLKVRLEMIEIALVQQNDTLFKSSITDARQWLKKNFAEDLKTEQFAAELDKLLHVALKAQLPDISLSSKLLKDINKLRIENDKAPSNQAAPPPSPSAESAAQ